MKKIHFDIIYTFVILAVILYLGAIFGFYVSNMMPGDPVLAALAAMGIHSPTVEQYNQMAEQLGFNLPRYIQFIRFFFDTAFGNWGFSVSINPGEPVVQLMAERLPRTIDMLMLPLIIGLILGFLFGYLAAKHRHKGFRGVIRVLSVLGFALPIMLIGMFFQHFISYGLSNLLGFQVLPAVGYKNMAYPNPPFVTGFRIIDSMLSGEWYLIPDYLWHLVLPWTVLAISFTSVITLFVRSYLLNKDKKHSVWRNTLNIGLVFGILFAILIAVDTTFNFYGFASLFLASINLLDFWLLRASLFIIVLAFAITSLIGNVLYFFYPMTKKSALERFGKERSMGPKVVNYPADGIPNQKQENDETLTTDGGERELSPYTEFRSYFLKKLKNPMVIIGLIIFVFFILISIFPQLLTPYTIEEANGVLPGAWSPPSPDHPLGRTEFGRDVLARIVYAIQPALFLGFGAIAIGLIGVIIGGLMNFINRKIKTTSEGTLIFFYIHPMIVVLIFVPILVSSIFGMILDFLMIAMLLTFGMFMMALFAQLTARLNFTSPFFSARNAFKLVKKLIIYIPLFLGLIFIVHSILGFFGFTNPYVIDLGREIEIARYHLYDAPWASLWPGFFLFLLILGFILLYEGFQKSGVKSKR